MVTQGPIASGVQEELHTVGYWDMKFTRDTYGVLPSITESKVSWTSESAASHPEPSRSSTLIRGPKVAMDAFQLEFGDKLRLFVKANGVDDVTGGTRAKNVAYMEGSVDGLERARFNTGGSRYATLPVSVSTTDPEARVTLIQDHGTSMDGRIVLGNTSETARSITFVASMAPGSSAPRKSQGTYQGGPMKYAGMRATFTGAEQILYQDVLMNGSETSTMPGSGGSSSTHDVVVTVTNVQPWQTMHLLIVGVEQPGQRRLGELEGTEVLVLGSDHLARLGRLMVGDSPWPLRQVFSRIRDDLQPLATKANIILDYYPHRFNQHEPGWYDLVTQNYVRPLDVDNRSALDVYRQTCAAVGRVALGLAGRVGMSWALKPANVLSVQSGAAQITPNPAASLIPSSAIPETNLSVSADKVATRINVTWWLPGPEYSSNPQDVVEQNYVISNEEAIGRFGVVERKIETHQFTTNSSWTLPNIAESLVNKAHLMLNEQSNPEWYFTGDTQIVPDDLGEVRGLAELIDNASRFGRLVRFTGLLPDGVERDHRVIGGSFGMVDGKWRLSLEVEPSNFSGTDTATYGQVASVTALTFNAVKAPNPDLTILTMRSTGL